MGKKAVVDAVIAVVTQVTSNKDFQKFICGTYSDGSTRSLPDAINDELYSPRQKKRADDTIGKKGKKKKGHKKHKSKKFKL